MPGQPQNDQQDRRRVTNPSGACLSSRKWGKSSPSSDPVQHARSISLAQRTEILEKWVASHGTDFSKRQSPAKQKGSKQMWCQGTNKDFNYLYKDANNMICTESHTGYGGT